MKENHYLEQLRTHMSMDLDSAMHDQKAELLDALQKASTAGADNDAPMKFSVALSGTLDLTKNVVNTAFSFSVKTTVKDAHALESADQPGLGF